VRSGGGLDAAAATGLLAPSSHPFLGERLVTPSAQAQFLATVTAGDLPLVGDHRIAGLPWLNFVLYLELAFAGAAAGFGAVPRGAAEVEVARGVVLPDGTERRLHLVLDPPEAGSCAFRLFSPTAESTAGPAAPAWTLHARGRVLLGGDGAADAAEAGLGAVDLDAVRRRCPEESDGAALYRAMAEAGAELGPACRWLGEIRRGPGEALARLRPPRGAEGSDGFHLPLGAFDGCFQVLAAALPAEVPRDWMLFRLDDLELDRERLPDDAAGGGRWCRAVLEPFDAASEVARGDIQLLDDAGRVLAAIRGAELRRVGAEARRLAAEAAPAQAARRRRSDLDLEALRAAAPEERLQRVETYLCEELARTLGLPVAAVDRETPLVAQIDSLMAVELKTRIEVDLELEVPVAAFFEGRAVGGLAALVSALLAGSGAGGEQEAAAELEELLAEIEGLSDEEAEARLAVRGGRVAKSGGEGGGAAAGRTVGSCGADADG
jgi:acyl carrier protein